MFCAHLRLDDFRNYAHLDCDLPAGISVFPGEGVHVPRIWAERAYSDLVYFNDQIPAGGHFDAFEQPQLFTEEVRKFARKVR